MQRQGNIKEQKHYKARHLKLNDLKQEAQDTHLYKKYLCKDDIPPYPGPGEVSLEFHVSRLKHDTYKLEEIKNDGGFKDPNSGSKDPDRLSLVWWSLAVAPEEIQSAERRLLEETFPNWTEEQARRKQSFLWKFASSPAFSEKSRYGSYRFTFTVEEVLEAYSEQFCSGCPPVMRVLRTSLYRQEVMYAVLVHSSDSDWLFAEYPILPDAPNTVCAYRDGRFTWRPEAMCGTHKYVLLQRRDKNLMEAWGLIQDPQYYVWDHVAIALHVEGGQVLKFDSDDLRKNLTFCEPDAVTVTPESDFQHYEDAQNLVARLWPLKKEVSLQQRIRAGSTDSLR
ncbi:uncharacterized protein LOC120432697 isoform X1 [Oreochromis aureus]|uniref:uncharacterized protein LOC120432697 isoform X1 n=1 Tax=Oreochromis aureus TaxID=47969 RepID=UPI0019532164|nr:uncharacterized protein LOC120432697 isoform X1 [Oreochromis aureus]XP_039474739.1 uncharacterized protein LOC120432697 isoform X1 [Oreochromis aureus]